MRPKIRPTAKQHLAWQALLDPTKSFIGFGGGAGSGKTWLGCEWLFTACFMYPGLKAYMGREELKRLMSSTYLTMVKVLNHHKIPTEEWKLNGQYNYMEFKNGSRIDLLDLKYLPSDPLYERFGSLEYTLGWIEEAGEVNFTAFDVLKSRVGRHMNREFKLPSKQLLTFNPKKNWLYSTIYKPFKEGTLPDDWAFIQSLYSDNPYTAEEYGKNLSGIKDKALKERLMFGNWEYDDDPSVLIDYDAITDLFSNTVEPSTQRYISADIARYGGDKIVMMVWEGLKVTRVLVKNKQGIDTTANDIRTLSRENMVPYSNIIVDSDGIGGGVEDILTGIKGFTAQNAPMDDPNTHRKENYRNLKAQCYFRLAEYINNHKIAIETDDSKVMESIKEELEQVRRADVDNDGKLALISKEDVKAILGRSPDFADALMMRMVFEYKKPGMNQGRVFYPSHSRPGNVV